MDVFYTSDTLTGYTTRSYTEHVYHKLKACNSSTFFAKHKKLRISFLVDNLKFKKCLCQII